MTMTYIHQNKLYVATFPEHVRFLIEKSTHKVVAVYKEHLNKEKEVLTKENYKQICEDVQKAYNERVSPPADLFMVFDIPDLTLTIYTDSYRETSIDIKSTNNYNNYLKF
jgi:hypothetical protein